MEATGVADHTTCTCPPPGEGIAAEDIRLCPFHGPFAIAYQAEVVELTEVRRAAEVDAARAWVEGEREARRRYHEAVLAASQGQKETRDV